MNSKDVSDFTLEQFLLDELPAQERERVTALLAIDGELRSRLEQLENGRRSFAASARARAVLKAIVPQATRKKTSRLARWSAAVPLGIGVAALALLVPLAFPPASGSDTRIKGGSLDPLPRGFPRSLALEKEDRIAAFVFKDGKTAELSDGTPVQQGDRVQLAVNVAKSRHALLLSVDGSGHLTLHAPDSLKASLLGDGTPKLLPFAYQLDNAPYFERFVLVTGAGNFDAQKIWNAIEAQTAVWLPAHPGQPPVLKLDPGLNLNLFDLRKLNKENS